MGQKYSALKKIRKAGKKAQRSSTLNEPTNELLSSKDDFSVSSEDDYFVPSSNGEECTQFSSVDNSSEALTPIPDLEAGIAPTILPKLCTELILDIANYLPPSSQMSLSYSCRTIRDKMGVCFAEVLGDKVPKGRLSGSTLSIESRNIRYLERLELWSMLVRDGKIPRWRATFSEYRAKTFYEKLTVTGRSRYVPDSREHDCYGTTGLLWLCPHRILNFNDAKKRRERNDSHTCGSSWVSESSSGHTRWSIMQIPANSVPTRKEVVEALRPLNAPICPHLRLNDARVARIYDPKCQKLHGITSRKCFDLFQACSCSVCSSAERLRLICSYCGTEAMFSIKVDFSNRTVFDLFIIRSIYYLGSSYLGSSSGLDWICQVARPTDLEDYERAWEATNAECLRKLRDD